jgi:hypothetical protein
MFQRAKQAGVMLEWPLVENVVNGAQGVAVPVSQPAFGLDTYLASARLVENSIPDGSTWDGSDRPVPIKSNPPDPVASTGGR